MITRVLVFTVLCLIALGDCAFAELYQYADEKGAIHITNDPGSIPEKQRKRVKVVKEVDRGPSPDTNGISHADTGARATAPVAASAASTGPAPQTSASPHQQLATTSTDTQHTVSTVDAFFARQFQSLLKEKFKDAPDPAQLAAINADTSIDCTKYKKTMDEDLTNMDALMKDVNRRKAQGDSEFLIKLQVIWGLRHIVNMLYDAVVTPKHCQDEFGRENKDRLADLNKELAGAQK